MIGNVCVDIGTISDRQEVFELAWSYRKLDNRGKFRRTILLNFFTLIAIIMLFLTPQLPVEVKVILSLTIIIAGIVQVRRDYLRLQK